MNHIQRVITQSDNDQKEENATMVTPPTRNELDDAMEILSKLSMFTDDVYFAP